MNYALLCVLTCFIFVSSSSGFSFTLKNLEFLKDWLKFPVYIDPHPRCALEDEACTDDDNCCGGRECKMTVDRKGLKYTCQGRVASGRSEAEGDEWTREWEGEGEEEDSNSIMREVYKAKLAALKQEEQRLVNDQYYMIKELQKPLTFDEMRELQQIKEMEDYKRENELKELRKWRENKKAEELLRREKEKKLKDLAAERVAKVLKEEEKQKKDIFKEIQDEMKRKKSWF